jgi:hypothetical protein
MAGVDHRQHVLSGDPAPKSRTDHVRRLESVLDHQSADDR